MNYPKLIMKISELVKIGHTREELLRLYRMPNQDFAWKKSDAINSVIVFNTEKLQAYIDKNRKLQQKAMRRRGY